MSGSRMKDGPSHGICTHCKACAENATDLILISRLRSKAACWDSKMFHKLLWKWSTLCLPSLLTSLSASPLCVRWFLTSPLFYTFAFMSLFINSGPLLLAEIVLLLFLCLKKQPSMQEKLSIEMNQCLPRFLWRQKCLTYWHGSWGQR